MNIIINGKLIKKYTDYRVWYFLNCYIKPHTHTEEEALSILLSNDWLAWKFALVFIAHVQLIEIMKEVGLLKSRTRCIK